MTTPMRITRLSDKTFEQVIASVRSRRRLGEDARKMAYAVLVEGRKALDVAAEYGVTRQRVSLAVSSVRRAYAKSLTLEESVVSIELELPIALARELAELAAVLAKPLDAEKRDAAIEKVRIAIHSARTRLSD